MRGGCGFIRNAPSFAPCVCVRACALFRPGKGGVLPQVGICGSSCDHKQPGIERKAIRYSNAREKKTGVRCGIHDVAFVAVVLGGCVLVASYQAPVPPRPCTVQSEAPPDGCVYGNVASVTVVVEYRLESISYATFVYSAVDILFMCWWCRQASDFATLAKASTAVPIMDEEPPEGCAVHIIDDQSQARILYRRYRF